jgi:hypothetical protein
MLSKIIKAFNVFRGKKLAVRRLEDFHTRPIYSKLTKRVINRTPDEDLPQTVIDNLCTKLPSDYSKYNEIILAWNKSRQAFYFVWLLECEVNNGGYNQFYFNSHAQYNDFLVPALKLIGARKYVELTAMANRIFERQFEKISEHWDGTLEGFSKSYENNPLSPFDDAFYAFEKEENLQQLLVNYIRMHKQDFID